MITSFILMEKKGEERKRLLVTLRSVFYGESYARCKDI